MNKNTGARGKLLGTLLVAICRGGPEREWSSVVTRTMPLSPPFQEPLPHGATGGVTGYLACAPMFSFILLTTVPRCTIQNISDLAQ